MSFQQLHSIRNLNDNFDQRMFIETQSRQDTRNALHNIREKFDELPAISMRQFEELKAILVQVQSPIKAPPAVHVPAERPADSIDQLTSDAAQGSVQQIEDDWERRELRDSINRLCSLADKEGDETLIETQPLIEDLDKLLDAVMATAAGKSRSLSKRKRDQDNRFFSVSLLISLFPQILTSSINFPGTFTSCNPYSRVVVYRNPQETSPRIFELSEESRVFWMRVFSS